MGIPKCTTFLTPAREWAEEFFDRQDEEADINEDHDQVQEVRWGVPAYRVVIVVVIAAAAGGGAGGGPQPLGTLLKYPFLPIFGGGEQLLL